jgi:hypothetical protein
MEGGRFPPARVCRSLGRPEALAWDCTIARRIVNAGTGLGARISSKLGGGKTFAGVTRVTANLLVVL